MAIGSTVLDRIRLVVEASLNVALPDNAADLIDSGFMDSLGLVTLIASLEEEVGVDVPLDDFEIDDFRSIDRIAAFVCRASPTLT